jgi:hypothetical protein
MRRFSLLFALARPDSMAEIGRCGLTVVGTAGEHVALAGHDV